MRPEDLAAKIAQLAANPDSYRKMSAAALEDARLRFNNERYVAEVYEVLQTVIVRRGEVAAAPVAAAPTPTPPSLPAAVTPGAEALATGFV